MVKIMDVGSDLFDNINFEKSLFSLYNEKLIFKNPVKIDFIDEKTKIQFTTISDNDKVMLDEEYVVFDFETTGTMPQEDKITEIGAVKIVDGKIVERFATMVNPERKIPELSNSLVSIVSK